MDILNKVCSDYRLYLTIFGSLTYLAIYYVDYLKNDKTNRVPIEFTTMLIMFFSYIMLGVFSYIAFYEDIQKAQNKTIILLGFSSYYFVSKLRQKYSGKKP